MSTLDVTIVQADLHWHDASRNCDSFEEVINGLEDPGDLIVLPEMFSTGFTMEAQTQAERWNGPSVKWMRRVAAERNTCLCGSLIIEDNGHFYNRFILMRPDGSHALYDKRHLFRLAGEHRHYSAGNELIAFEINGFRICPMICYDLRFPVWTRNRNDYDALIFVANWPAKRRIHWRQLLIARAIENQAYCVGLNRVGADDNGLTYSGDSLVLAADGTLLLDCEDAAGVFYATLDYAAMEQYRSKFPCHKNADTFELKP